MKLLPVFALAIMSSGAFAQVCEVDMVDRYNRVIQTFRAYGEPSSCVEGMKECRKAIRLGPQLGGVDCIRVAQQQPTPTPIPTPIPQPQPQPQPYPQPQPQPYPQPNPNTYPQDVLRMSDLDQAINFALQDCHVVPRVSGIFNQLYVSGQFAGNFEIGRQDSELRRAIRDRQARGVCQLKQPQLLNIQFDQALIDDAIDRSLSRNCYVLPRVSGIFNQLYIDGQFTGNYDVNNSHEQMKLRANLAGNLYSGKCQQRTYEEIRMLRDPYLIQDFANYQYRNCHVVLNVSGIFNQLYVRGQFAGNYDKNTEVNKLKSVLVDKILQGQCQYDPM